jgi:hypothetical protein
MNFYRPIDQLRSSELTVVRTGFWNPDYLLSDGQFEYGKLSLVSFSSSEKVIETANNTYTMRKPGRFSKEMLILRNGGVIGKTTRNAWKCITTIELNDGFTASFVKTPGRGIFSTKMSWVANDAELMMIAWKSKYSRPMTVSIIDQNIARQTDRLLLLAFIGMHTRLMMQAQAAG